MYKIALEIYTYTTSSLPPCIGSKLSLLQKSLSAHKSWLIENRTGNICCSVLAPCTHSVQAELIWPRTTQFSPSLSLNEEVMPAIKITTTQEHGPLPAKMDKHESCSRSLKVTLWKSSFFQHLFFQLRFLVWITWICTNNICIMSYLSIENILWAIR